LRLPAAVSLLCSYVAGRQRPDQKSTNHGPKSKTPEDKLRQGIAIYEITTGIPQNKGMTFFLTIEIFGLAGGDRARRGGQSGQNGRSTHHKQVVRARRWHRWHVLT
jgi:hypothetical protein